jgi:hypothetical protein
VSVATLYQTSFALASAEKDDLRSRFCKLTIDNSTSFTSFKHALSLIKKLAAGFGVMYRKVTTIFIGIDNQRLSARLDYIERGYSKAPGK